jgi:hypothetical protein
MNINILIRFSLPLFLLLCLFPLCAQPVLQEWWRAPENMVVGRGISYLPNFYNGKGALAISVQRVAGTNVTNTFETWLNRYKGDTNSVFNWKGGTFVKRADFNGDGITDYIDGGGFIYQGIKNGEPPNPEPVTKIDFLSGVDNCFVLDADNDGLDDIVFNFSAIKLNVVKGKKDIRTMVTEKDNINIPGFQNGDRSYIRGAYIGRDSVLKIVVMEYRTDWNEEKDNIDIYSITWPVADSLAQVRRTGRIRGLYDQWTFFNGTVYILRISADSQYMFVSKLGTTFSKYIYDLRTDTPKLIDSIPYDGGQFLFEKSVSGGMKPDYAIIYSNFGDLALFRGGFPLSKQPMAKAQAYRIDFDGVSSDTFKIGTICMLDDVNGDGINDIAVGCNSTLTPNIFRILLGQATTLSVHENMDTAFSLADPMPHPLQQSSLLKIMIDKPDLYTLRLSSIDGSMSKSIFEGRLEQGDHLFSISPDGLPPGAALLQLFRGSQLIASRIIILQ